MRRSAAKEKVKAARRQEMAAAGVPKQTHTELFFALTLFVSAALLFAVQPMFAKMVLPLLGGAPAVWNTCLVFYQATLLAGYTYAHLSLKWLGPRRQAALHLALLCLPWLVLPIHVAQGWAPPANAFPIPWLWMLLSVSVGLPFLLVSASAPMLQAWFSRTGGRSAPDPYFLYAASNLGSLLALLSYPLVIESHLTLPRQSWWWASGYGLLMVLIGGCAVRLWRSPPVGPAAAQTALQGRGTDRLTARRRLHWLALSLVPSSLLLGVTTHISADIAAVPLLWVIPLALYLLTFVLVFARRTLLPLSWMVRIEPYLVVAVAVTFLWTVMQQLPIVALVGLLHLGAFFVIAMVCHGQLAADRPASSRTTEFYLWMSLGGVLGGLLGGLFAPLVFSGVQEYPLMIAAACMLRPRTATPGSVRVIALSAAVLLVCGGAAWAMRQEAVLDAWQYADAPPTKVVVVGLAAVAVFFLRRRPLPFGVGVAALSALSFWCAQTNARVLDAERSFFGVLRVIHDPFANTNDLQHGATMHGRQSLQKDERHEPWTYYHRQGPLGQIFRALQPRRPLAEIGVLGLGTGTIAAYGQPGERITFYEIDPLVEHIARNPKYFTYLADCPAKVEVILGDARLSLLRGPPRQFDLLVVDVYSSDSVPVHLITREALRIYLQRLAERGLLAIHISSRYFDLGPILGRLAEDAGVVSRVRADRGRPDAVVVGKMASTWVVMARRLEDLGELAKDPGWWRLRSTGEPLWTDDFSNIADAIEWRFSWKGLLSSMWQGSHRASDHYSLGYALATRGRIDEAIAEYQKALEIQPDFAQAHNNLGTVLATSGRPDEAMAHYRKALEIQPDFTEAHNNLGSALAARGQLDEAVAHYRKALDIRPDDAKAHNNLANALAKRGRPDEALSHFRKALEIQPDSVQTINDLAWLLATCPEASLRNGAKAVEFARRAEQLTGGRQAEVLDTLAAAYAAAGRFPEALATARKALELATKQNLQTLADALRLRIALYQSGKPFHQPGGRPSRD